VDVRSRGRSRSDGSISLEIDRRSFDVRSNMFEVFRTIVRDLYAQCETSGVISEVVLQGGPINGHIEPFQGPWDHTVSAIQPCT
jgi:hypothetical protein